jgi:hypothetical protein
MTVRDYVKGIFSKDGKVFKLSRTEKVHSKWRGKAFAELEEEEQRRIRNTTIHAIIFMQRSPLEGDTSLFQVFERINSSGRTLLPQEIRNCVYLGPFNSLLLEINENESWRRLFGKEDKDERMRDVEFILRFFALSSEEILFDNDPPPRISLKKYLNQFMDRFNDSVYMDEFRRRFNSAVYKAEIAFGDGAFHNISPTNPEHLVERFSLTLFDSVLIAFYLADKEKKPDLTPDHAKAKKLEILLKEDYQRLLSQETMRVPNIRERVFKMYNALFSE